MNREQPKAKPLKHEIKGSDDAARQVLEFERHCKFNAKYIETIAQGSWNTPQGKATGIILLRLRGLIPDVPFNEITEKMFLEAMKKLVEQK